MPVWPLDILSFLAIDYEAFTTREKLLRTPNNDTDHTAAPTTDSLPRNNDQLSTEYQSLLPRTTTPHKVDDDDDGSSSHSSSSSDFNLLSNEVPPTPYREIDLTPAGIPVGTRTAGGIGTDVLPPLILLEDSDD